MSGKITRRQAAYTLSALPVLSAAPPLKFFKPAEAEAVAALAEAIIPTTSTPGARAAGVPEYIDWLLSEDESQASSFMAGLGWIEEKSTSLFGSGFAKLTATHQTELLTRISDAQTNVAPEDGPGAAFFRQLKVLVCNGYYFSKVGLEQEIRFQGNAAVRDYPSCDSLGDRESGPTHRHAKRK